MTWPGAPGTPCAEGVRCSSISSISSIRPLRVVLIQRDELNDSAIRRNGWIVTRLGPSTPRCILNIQIVKLSTASTATMLFRTAYEGLLEVALAISVSRRELSRRADRSRNQPYTGYSIAQIPHSVNRRGHFS